MQKTGIEWTDYSSNPLRAVERATGKRGWSCTAVSPGCDNCYSATLNRRWGTGLPYDKASESAVDWELNERELDAILTSKASGARVFVADMTDLFHVSVRREWLDRIFATFALRPDLTFQCLTKRPQIAANYLNDRNVIAERPDTRARILDAAERIAIERKSRALDERLRASLGGTLGGELPWPLPNVWLGTSVEDNRVRHRIAPLRRAPAAVHFLSCEPLIGPLDLSDGHLDHIEWVITGGESGPNHRPFDPQWAIDIRDECARARVAHLHKQNGGLTPKSGGRLLDGREWNQFPMQSVAMEV